FPSTRKMQKGKKGGASPVLRTGSAPLVPGKVTRVIGQKLDDQRASAWSQPFRHPCHAP
ncbi:hypothetical protein JTE90_009624, partial [Oedothorax gibbosus]